MPDENNLHGPLLSQLESGKRAVLLVAGEVSYFSRYAERIMRLRSHKLRDSRRIARADYLLPLLAVS
jgi:hypothetical protein